MSGKALRRGRLLGYFEAVAAACLWGSSGIFAVHLFRLGVTPESVAVLRPAVGVLFLFGGAALLRPRALLVDGRGLAVLALGGGTAIGIFQLAYQLSTDAVGVPSTVALLYLAPAFVTAASGPLLGEWPGRHRVALVVLTVSGVWLSVLGAEEVASTFGSTGLAWGALAGASYATYTVFGRWATPRYGSLTTVLYATAGACAVLVLVLPLLSLDVAPPTEPRPWLLLLAFGALTIAVAQLLFFDALGRIEASGASVATAAEPAVAAVLATVMLSQGLRPLGWVGVALIVAGVVGVGLEARPRRPPRGGPAEPP